MLLIYLTKWIVMTTKQTFNLQLDSDIEARLRLNVGRVISSWEEPAQHIIEDSVLFDLPHTVAILESNNIDAIAASEALIEIQNRFDKYNEHTNRIIMANNAPLTMDLSIIIHFMLPHSIFFKHKLHVQPQLSTSEYELARITLSSDFASDIPRE